MKTARCKITEIKEELLEDVETTIHKPAPGNQLTDIFSMIVLKVLNPLSFLLQTNNRQSTKTSCNNASF